MRPHRIALVVGQLTIGGLERQVSLLARGLNRSRFDPTVISLSRGGTWTTRLRDDGVPVIEIERHGHLDWRRFARLVRELRALRPRLVYSFNYGGNAYARPAGFLARVPLQVAGELGVYAPLRRRILERLFAPLTARVICNSEAVREFWIRKCRTPPRRVVTIHNGVEPAEGDRSALRRAARVRLGLPEYGVVVGTVARLDPVKNLPLIVEAAAIGRDSDPMLKFCIVGGGPEETFLKSRIVAGGLTGVVRMAGEFQEARNLIPAFDVFLLTSHSESLPNGVLEAMAAGLPCVCTDVGGCRELIQDGVHGFIVPPGDAAAIADRLRRLAADPGLRERLGEAARRRAREEFSVRRMVEKTESLLLDLLEAPAGRQDDRARATATQASISEDPVRVTVVMPVRNEGRSIAATLGAVLAQDYPTSHFEVIVADGQSEDGTRDEVRSLMARHANLTMVDNPGRVVPSGLNQAIRMARGDYVVRVDGHTLLEPDYVAQCVALLRATGAENVGGPMRARGEGWFGRAVAAATSVSFGVGGARFHVSDREEWADTVYLGAWPRRVFERHGGFDEEMTRNQDDEFNYRLLDAGGRILLSPRIRSLYSVRGTPSALWRQYSQYGFWKVRVMQKHPHQIRWRQLAPPALVLAVAGLAALIPIWPAAGVAWISLVGTYLAVSVAASLGAARRRGWDLLPILPAVFAILHMSYGSGLLVGFLRFAGRWGDRGRPVPIGPAGESVS